MTDVLAITFIAGDSYNKIQNDLIRCCVSSFRYHNSNADILLFTNVPSLESKEYDTIYDDTKEAWKFKPQKCLSVMSRYRDNDRMIYCDYDMIYMDDPFSDAVLWEKVEDTIGTSSRMYEYMYSTTSAFLCFRNGAKPRKIFEDYSSFSSQNKQSPEMEYFSCLLNQGVLIDLGFLWDYCPGIEKIPRVVVRSMYHRACKTRSVKAIHLKGDSKLYIYDKEIKELPEVRAILNAEAKS
jgi:hypothetical protein